MQQSSKRYLVLSFLTTRDDSRSCNPNPDSSNSKMYSSNSDDFSNNYSLIFDLYFIHRDLSLNSRALQTFFHIKSNQLLRTIFSNSDLNITTRISLKSQRV